MRRTAIVTALLLTPMLVGCPATQNYVTARTLDEGKVQHVASVEFLRVFDICTTCDEVGFVPFPILGYQFRMGVAEQLELGGRFTTLGTAAVDFKVQFVRSDAFDLAIDPTLAFTSFFSYAYLPALFSINMGDAATLTLGPKIGYMWVFGDSGVSDSFLNAGYVGGSIAFTFRVGRKFSITPGFDYQRAFLQSEASSATGKLSFLTFGIGFSFGEQPTYGDPEPEPTYYAPPPGPQPQYGPPQGQSPPGYAPTPPPGY